MNELKYYLLGMAIGTVVVGAAWDVSDSQQTSTGLRIPVASPERAKAIAQALDPFNEPELECLEYEVATRTLQTCEPEA